MIKFLDIITNVPSLIRINNELFVNNDKNLSLKIENENLFVFEIKPLNLNEFCDYNFIVDLNNLADCPVKNIVYDEILRLEINLKSNSIKSFSKNLNGKNCEILNSDTCLFVYDTNSFVLDTFKHSYFSFDIEKLNDKYIILKGFFKKNPLLPIKDTNYRLDVSVFDAENQSIIHSDTCDFVEKNNNIFSVNTYMLDQNKHLLTVEFYVGNTFEFNDFYSSYTLSKPREIKNKSIMLCSFFESILAQNSSILPNYICDDLKNQIINKDLHKLFDNYYQIDFNYIKKPNEINLIFHKKNNSYYAKKFFAVFNDKIFNISAT